MKVDYNNIGIGALAIGSVLSINNELSLSKTTLILPFITHTECLNYLARATTQATSIEKLIAERTSYFSNFNARYYDTLCLSFSSIQYLTEMGYAKLQGDLLLKKKSLEYNAKMGNRAKKIFQATNNLSALLLENDKKLYLNLRVQL
jgi:tRNA A22 N-methylase